MGFVGLGEGKRGGCGTYWVFGGDEVGYFGAAWFWRLRCLALMGFGVWGLWIVRLLVVLAVLAVSLG